MAFASDSDPWAGEVAGRRVSFPGDPRAVWEKASKGRAPLLERPRDVPWPTSVEEVAKWEDPDGFGRTELYHAPIFWVLLPVAVTGYLIWGTITDPGDGWTGNLFDDDATGNLWNFWLVWVGVAIWLLIAIAVLVFRVSLTSEVRADNEWIFRHGIPCTIHRSPYDRDGGEGDMWPTFIGIDHRVPDEKAARIHRALHEWLESDEVQGELSLRVGTGRAIISSQDLFGTDAAGGYFLPSIPGFGTADHFIEHKWVLITARRDEDVDGAHATVTTVPLKEKRQKTRRKLRAQSGQPEA